MSVLVCIPTHSDIYAETAELAMAICAHHAGGASFRAVRAHPIDRCRNLCVQRFLGSPHSHLLFLDSDVVPPADCLERMLALELPLVTGIYPIQVEGELCAALAHQMGPDLYGFLHDFPDEPFEIDAAGLGCCLIAREVLERIDAPWFEFSVRPDLSQRGEDIDFFEKCAEAGFKPVALPEVLCAHHRVLNLLDAFESTRKLRRENASLRQAAAPVPSA